MGRAFGARGGRARDGDTSGEENVETCERLVALAPFDGKRPTCNAPRPTLNSEG